MTTGQNEGDSVTETVDSAASAFAALLSEEEHPESPKAPTPKESTDDTDVENEPVDEVDESTSEDDEPADEEQDDEEQPADEESSEPDKKSKTRKIKVDGQDVEVTEEELEKGYSRTADYTRKTQKLAEERKAFEESELKPIREERKQLAEQLTQLKTALEALMPQEPDWDKLREENPNDFPLVWAEWQRHKDALEKFSAKQQEALKKVQEDQRQHLQEYIRNEQNALLEALPEWKKPEVAKREAAEMGEFAKSLGYSDEDVNNVVDHRLVLLLRKAMLYDKAQKQKPVVREKIAAVKAATPGPSQKVSKPKSEFAKRAQRLRNSGSVKDAAALFEMFED